MEMIKQTAPEEYETSIVVTNELGLHARPAALLAKTAQQFTADIILIASDREADAKSILDILSLAATQGTTLTVRGRGNDARDSIKSIAELVRAQFHEEYA
ncbi:phosphocarrier protein HPr [Deltaproteobacteria bacterium]|nr:phosphocarrier protein HPr [Deltaproteobacteria bacterium]